MILLFMLMWVVIFPGNAFAGRPLTTEDAGVAGKNLKEFEVSWDYLHWANGDKLLFVSIYGVTKIIELSLEIRYLFYDPAQGRSQNGISDITIVLDTLMQDGDAPHALALVSAPTFPVASSKLSL